MKKKRFSVEQIMGILKQAELGTPTAELCRQLKQLRDENTKLKRLAADLSLDKVMLQDVLKKKVAKPVKKREVVHYLMNCYGIGTRRACRCVPFFRSVYY